MLFKEYYIRRDSGYNVVGIVEKVKMYGGGPKCAWRRVTLQMACFNGYFELFPTFQTNIIAADHEIAVYPA